MAGGRGSAGRSADSGRPRVIDIEEILLSVKSWGGNRLPLHRARRLDDRATDPIAALMKMATLNVGAVGVELEKVARMAQSWRAERDCAASRVTGDRPVATPRATRKSADVAVETRRRRARARRSEIERRHARRRYRREIVAVLRPAIGRNY